MKNWKNLSLVAIITIFGIVSFTTCGGDDNDDDSNGELTFKYELGDTGPGGGIIFYYSANGFTMTDDYKTCHYLEAAPTDMVTTLQWAVDSSGGYRLSDAIGAGRSHTAYILTIETNAPAVSACKNLNTGGKTDWFLPSMNELNELYKNRVLVGNLKTTIDEENYTHIYWSSSQHNGLYAWSQNFTNDSKETKDKTDTYSVRAIRAF